MSQKQDRKRMYEELAFGLPSRSSRKKKEETLKPDVNQEITHDFIQSEDNVALTSMEQIVEQQVDIMSFPPRSTVHKKENPADVIDSVENHNIFLSEDIKPISHFDQAIFSEDEKVQKDYEDSLMLFQNEHKSTKDEDVQELKEKENDEYTNFSPEEVLEELRKKNFHPIEATDVEDVNDDNAKTDNVFEENLTGDTEESLLEDKNEQMFIPRSSNKRKGHKGKDTNPQQKKSTSVAFVLSIVFGLIVVVVLFVGIYLLTNDQGEAKTVPPIETEQMGYIEKAEGKVVEETNDVDEAVNDKKDVVDVKEVPEIKEVDGIQYEIFYHTVLKNENLTNISKKYYGNTLGIDLIYKWNQLDSAVIHEGNTLEIPIPK